MIRIRATGYAVAAALLALAPAGCGGGPKTAPVHGRVTLDGHTVAGGNVSFLAPNSGVPVTVPINTDGTYQADGVPVGEVTVTVTGAGGAEAGEVIKKGGLNKKGPAPPPEGKIPKQYGDPATSGLSTTVTEAGTQYDIIMSSK